MPSCSSKSWQEFMLTWPLLVATDYNSIPSAFPFPKKSKTTIRRRSYVSILNPHIFTPESEGKRINSPHYRCESHYLMHFWKMLKYHSDGHSIRIWKAQNRNRMEKGNRAQGLAIHTDTHHKLYFLKNEEIHPCPFLKYLYSSFDNISKRQLLFLASFFILSYFSMEWNDTNLLLSQTKIPSTSKGACLRGELHLNKDCRI